MATPRILPVETEPKHSSNWSTKAAKPEVVLRYTDLLADTVNSCGLAITNIISLIVMTPGMLGLVVAEVSVRGDHRIARKFEQRTPSGIQPLEWAGAAAIIAGCLLILLGVTRG